MSLKGYQWLDDNKIVLMSYTFKDEVLDVWRDTTKDELENFKRFLKEHHCETYKIEIHNCKII